MNKPLSSKELGELFQAIDNEVTGKLSKLADIAGLSLAEDYIGVDLSGENLSEDDLTEVNFKGGNLSNVNLSFSNLTRADLRGVNLSGANLSYSNLSGADLRGANLSKAKLRGSYLKHSQIDQTTKINLKWRLVWQIVNLGIDSVNLDKNNLSEANLSEANLRGIDLSNANLRGFNLRGANLREANLRGADLRGTDLRGADLRWAYLNEADLSCFVINRRGLHRRSLRRKTNREYVYKYTNLQNAELHGAIVNNAKFIKVKGISSKQKQELIEQGAILHGQPESRFLSSGIPRMVIKEPSRRRKYFSSNPKIK